MNIVPLTQSGPTFADFWLLYPKKVARLDAEKAWNRLSNVHRVDAVSALVNWRTLWFAEASGCRFAPHAATWLNGQRWEDELPENWGHRHASHQPAKIPEAGPHTQMPDNVRAVIAKLKGAA